MDSRLVFVALALAACSGRVPHPPYATQPTEALVEVDYPPPPARVEYVTDQPAKNTVWLRGEWSWTGRRWAWKPGGWVVVPQGAAYAQLTVVRRTDGKLFAALGTWRNAKGEEIPAPEFKAGTPSKASTVVDPEGDIAPTAGDLRSDAGADARERAPVPAREEQESQPKEEGRTP